jgi:hypothetical protein
MQDYFEINVCLHGRHFFATAPRSCTSRTEARKVYNSIKSKFPESEGFDVTVHQWESSAQTVVFE